MATLDELIKQRDEFLEAKPYLKPFQARIDATFQHVTSPTERLFILMRAIGDASQELEQALNDLTEQTKDLGRKISAYNSKKPTKCL